MLLTSPDLFCTSASGRVGAKAAALARLKTLAGFAVPDWFSVSPPIWSDAPTSVDAWQTRLQGFSWSSQDSRAFINAIGRIVPAGGTLAVRSSAEVEDGATHSHAGVFATALDVMPADVPRRVVDVWLSAFGPAVTTYRRACGLPILLSPPSVIVQRMLRPMFSGVGVLDNQDCDSVSIAVARGGGTGIVDGHETALLLSVRGNARFRGSFGGIPALTEELVLEIASLVRRASHHFGTAQDIEWAFADDRLYVLQSRPVTAPAPARDGTWALWANTNTEHLYPGVVSPLSFSLAQHTHEEIVRFSVGSLWFPGQHVARGSSPAGMFGQLRGRVYFDQLAWFRLQASFGALATDTPASRPRFEDVPDDVVAELVGTNQSRAKAHRRARRWRLWALILLTVSANQLVANFRSRVESVLDSVALDSDTCSPHDFLRRFEIVDRVLLRRWDGVLVNDFVAMRLHEFLARELRGGAEGRGNALLSGLGDVATADESLVLESIAQSVSAIPELIAVLARGGASEVAAAMEDRSHVADSFRRYVERFGDRAIDELLIESRTVRDDPFRSLRSIGNRARLLADGAPPLRPSYPPTTRDIWKGPWWRRPWQFWLLSQTRARFRDREKLRFERARVYSSLRRLFLAFGETLRSAGVLRDPRDVSFARFDELLAYARGEKDGCALSRIVGARSRAWAIYDNEEPPKPVVLAYRGRIFDVSSGTAMAVTGPTVPLRGVACSPGLAAGPARTEDDDALDPEQSRPILVARHARTSLIPLLPLVSGVVVEFGTPFSHLAIVARELRVPMVGGVPFARISQKQVWLDIDGDRGLVRICT